MKFTASARAFPWTILSVRILIPPCVKLIHLFRVTIAKQKEIERRKRELEELARQELVEKAQQQVLLRTLHHWELPFHIIKHLHLLFLGTVQENNFARDTKQFAEALHTIFCGIGEIGRGDKAQVAATQHYVKVESEVGGVST
jgi:hypothetical protein